MNRKLHNSLMAIFTSGTLLTITLVAAAPVAPLSHPPMPTATATADAVSNRAPTVRTKTSGNRRVYPSVQMPFFSFFLPKD